jgi:hypothetical protein
MTAFPRASAGVCSALFFAVPLGSAPGGTVSVFLPNGSPASGATAAALRTVPYLEVKNGVGVNRYGKPLPEVLADGRFEVADPDFGRFVFLHAQGWADQVIGAETREIRLQPWNEVRGNVVPSAGDASVVTFFREEVRGGTPDDRGTVYWTSQTTVLPDRTFTLGFLPAGRGVMGLEQAGSIHRRDVRWSAFPKEIEVPDSGTVSLGEPGVILRGHLPKTAPGPAMVEVNDRTGNRPAFFGMTDAAGAFAIPALAPGDFRLTARPLDDAHGKYVVQREFSVPDGVLVHDLGELPAPVPDVEIYRMVEYPDGLIEKVRTEAARRSRQPIRKIWLGQLTHPGGLWGARVTFAPEPVDETHAVARVFLVQIPGQTIRKFYPSHNTRGYGYRFGIGELIEPRLIEKTVRSFPLRSQTLHLPLSEHLAYETALALLKAIEEKSWKTPPSPKRQSGDYKWGWGVSAGPDLGPKDLPHIESLRRQNPGGRIEVKTRDGDFHGRSAEFEEKNGEFFLVGGGHWRA